jgi:succinyldiaminopimelate transaminase
VTGPPAAAPAFVLPEYPYDRLDQARKVADKHEGGAVDLSVGTPTDPPPRSVLEALATVAPATVAGYPLSAGSEEVRLAAAAWLAARFGVDLPAAAVALCVGTKELVASVPAMLALRSPGRDTVLYPAVAYPTYEVGAMLAGLRGAPVPVDSDGRLRLEAVAASDLERALLLWSNSPANPTGGLDDLEAVASWGRDHGVLVFSDECYAEFTWDGPPRSILQSGLRNVVAVHSLSKRSNMAGARVGFYAGDESIVSYLRELRKHAGLMVAGPVQAAAAAALADGDQVETQRSRYLERLLRAREIMRAVGSEAELPRGGFYLWAPVPDSFARPEGDWSWAAWLAEHAGLVVSPGSLYGPGGAGFVRVAMVAPLERLDLVAKRLGV